MSYTERLALKADSFLASNKKLIIIIAVAVLVVLIGIAVGVMVYNSKISNIYEDLYNLEVSYNNIVLLDETSDDYARSVSDFESAVLSFISSNNIRTYPGARATLLLAELRFLEEDWSDAYELSMSLAESHANDYLGPVGYINAAVAAENNGDSAEALRLYTYIWDNYGVTCPVAPQALFNQARLEYDRGNAEVARSIFEQLTSEFPNSTYTSIAGSWLLTF